MEPRRINRSRIARPSDTMRERARELRRAMTIPERALWNLLRAKQLDGFKFRRQIPVAGYVADYYCSECRLVVELDGQSHDGRGSQDAQRTRDLEQLGLRVIRITNDDVLQHPEAVRIYLLRICREQATSSSYSSRS